MKSITFPQALVLFACIAAPIVAYKLLDSAAAAGATMTIGMVLNFLLGRGDPPAPPAAGSGGPDLKVIAGGIVGMLAIGFGVSGCAAFLKDANYVLDAAQIACIIANAQSDDATVAQVCQVTNALIPDLKTILSAQRKALKKALKHEACDGGDAGACEAGASE